MSCYRDLNPGPLPYQGSALPLSYNSKEEKRRAEDGTQTRDPQLGRLMLYQLSYFRNFLWAKMDSNHRRRKPADLQSAPFGHSGICPFATDLLVFFSIAMQRYNYFFNLQTKSIIFIAVIAHSSPLLPNFPPARSSACSMLLVVIRP